MKKIFNIFSILLVGVILLWLLTSIVFSGFGGKMTYHLTNELREVVNIAFQDRDYQVIDMELGSNKITFSKTVAYIISVRKNNVPLDQLAEHLTKQGWQCKVIENHINATNDKYMLEIDKQGNRQYKAKIEINSIVDRLLFIVL